MKRIKTTTEKFQRVGLASGFTLIEVILAGSIMIILCVGILTVFSYTIKLNRGENFRMQALSVLQQEVELYRAAPFVPGTTDPMLIAATKPSTRANVLSADGTRFNVTTEWIDNDVTTPYPTVETSETNCKFKEIKISAVLANPQTGWLANLKTEVTIQRVRSN